MWSMAVKSLLSPFIRRPQMGFLQTKFINTTILKFISMSSFWLARRVRIKILHFHCCIHVHLYYRWTKRCKIDSEIIGRRFSTFCDMIIISKPCRQGYHINRSFHLKQYISTYLQVIPPAYTTQSNNDELRRIYHFAHCQECPVK